jgi:hypothetical protein
MSPGSSASTSIPVGSQSQCDDASSSEEDTPGPPYDDSSDSTDYGTRHAASDDEDDDEDDDDGDSDADDEGSNDDSGETDPVASEIVASASAVAMATEAAVAATDGSTATASLQEASRRCLADSLATVKKTADILSSASPLYPGAVHDLLAAAAEADGRVYPKDNGIISSCNINAILPKARSHGSFSVVSAGVGLQVTVRDVRQNCDSVNICVTELSYKDTLKGRIIRILGRTDYSGAAFHTDPISKNTFRNGSTIMSRIYRISGAPGTNVGVEMPSNTAISTVLANFNREPNNKLLVGCADTATLRAMPANNRAASDRIKLVTTRNDGNKASLCFWISLADALIAMSPQCGADRNALSLQLLAATKAFMKQPIALAHAVHLVLSDRRLDPRNRSAKCAAAQIIRSACARVKSSSVATEAAIAAYFPDPRDREPMGDDDARWKHNGVSELIGDLVGEFKVFSGTPSDEATDAVQSSKGAIAKDAAISALLSIPRNIKSGKENGHQGAMCASRMLSSAGIAGVSLITNSYDHFRVETLASPRFSDGAIIIVRGTLNHFEFVSSWDASHAVVPGPEMIAMIGGIEASWSVLETQQKWQATNSSSPSPVLPASTVPAASSTITEASVLAKAKSLGPAPLRMAQAAVARGSLLTHIDAVLSRGKQGVRQHCMQGGMCNEQKCRKSRSHKKLGPRGVKTPRARRTGEANARASGSQQRPSQHKQGSQSTGSAPASAPAAGTAATASSPASAAALPSAATAPVSVPLPAAASPSPATASTASQQQSPSLPLPSQPNRRQQQVEQQGAVMQQIQHALQQLVQLQLAQRGQQSGQQHYQQQQFGQYHHQQPYYQQQQPQQQQYGQYQHQQPYQQPLQQQQQQPFQQQFQSGSSQGQYAMPAWAPQSFMPPLPPMPQGWVLAPPGPMAGGGYPYAPAANSL